MMTLEMTEATFPGALEAHAQAVNQCCIDANTERAAATIARQLAEYERRYQERVELPCPPDVLARVGANYCEQYDTDLRQRTGRLDAEHQAIGQSIATAIMSARVLPTWIEIAPENDLRAVRYYMELDRAEKKVNGLTRRQVRELYESMTDDNDRTLTTLIERSLATLALRDDPDTDAIEIPRLQKAMAARQEQRIPKWLTDGQARHAEIRTLHFDHLHRHLIRDQRGVALVR